MTTLGKTSSCLGERLPKFSFWKVDKAKIGLWKTIAGCFLRAVSTFWSLRKQVTNCFSLETNNNMSVWLAFQVWKAKSENAFFQGGIPTYEDPIVFSRRNGTTKNARHKWVADSSKLFRLLFSLFFSCGNRQDSFRKFIQLNSST
jgi:hypothetical protein